MSNLVDNILNNGSYTNTNLTFNQINKNIIISVNNVYRPYILYKQNEENLSKSLSILLNNYECYNKNVILLPGDYIVYFNMNFKIGNNILLKRGGFIISENKNNIKLLNGNYTWNINKKNSIIFKKLNKNDIFRLNLNSYSNN